MAPLRRLTRYEYNNTVHGLTQVMDNPADLFPPEDIGAGFGTDAKLQSASDTLVEKYFTTAKSLAAALTAKERIGELAACAVQPSADEATCARTVAEGFAARAFRRPPEAGDVEGLVGLFQSLRTSGVTFDSAIAAMVEAVLQSPEFLYRPEFGEPVAGRTDVLRPTGYEMASRLSYLYTATMPDAELMRAAESGQLATADGVRAQALRLLEKASATRQQVRFFFDHLLPIQSLDALGRSGFPAFNDHIGALMRLETQLFLEDQVFNGGSWAQAFTAPHTFVNEELARFYGMANPPSGEAFVKVPVDGVKRAGLLTQAGIVAGPIHANFTNPVVRGSFILDKLLCKKLSTPPASFGPIIVPDPSSGGTARERFARHSSDAKCAACHKMLDPLGFALENFDAVGQWQEVENGQPIDVTVESPELGKFSGAVELGQRLAVSADAHACFVTNWANFAYGRETVDQDDCTLQQLKDSFQTGAYDIKELLLSLSQTDTFLYLPAVRQ